jgi:hypothetical protein
VPPGSQPGRTPISRLSPDRNRRKPFRTDLKSATVGPRFRPSGHERKRENTDDRHSPPLGSDPPLRNDPPVQAFLR